MTISCVQHCDPMDYTIHGILQVRMPECTAFPFSGDLPNLGLEPRSPALQAYSLPAEPPGKPSFKQLVSPKPFSARRRLLSLGLCSDPSRLPEQEWHVHGG